MPEKITLTIKKEIELPDIVINNFSDLSNKTLNTILFQIQSQIQPYFNQKIRVRRRKTGEPQQCIYCKRKFKNRTALNMHKARAHNIKKEKSNLFLSAHKVTSSKKRFLYFILENKADNTHQSVLKLAFKK
ncbi:MAG: hypothetical protein ACOC44_01325 [Promethearchaeia archaeon]